MQWLGSTSSAFPLIIPSISPSGQTRVQAPQPSPFTRSIFGCSEAGSRRPASSAAALVARLRASARLRNAIYRAPMTAKAKGYTPITGLKLIGARLLLEVGAPEGGRCRNVMNCAGEQHNQL